MKCIKRKGTGSQEGRDREAGLTAAETGEEESEDQAGPASHRPYSRRRQMSMKVFRETRASNLPGEGVSELVAVSAIGRWTAKPGGAGKRECHT